MIETYLPEFQDKVDRHRRIFSQLFTIQHGDHETALMRISAASETSWRSRRTEYVLVCDCDYKPNIGWHVTSTGEAVHRPKGIITPENCTYRNQALDVRRNQLKREFSRMEIAIPHGVSRSVENFMRIEHGLLWINSLLQNGELVGSAPGAHLQANTTSVKEVAAIMDVALPNNVAKVAEFMRQDGKINLEGNTIYAPVLAFDAPRKPVLT